jgi:protein PhnA
MVSIIIAKIVFKTAIAYNTFLKRSNKMAKDSNGSELKDGDSVSVIKDLKVKGSSLTIKRGTSVKNIRLTDVDDEVECRIDKHGTIVLKTCFLKKA